MRSITPVILITFITFITPAFAYAQNPRDIIRKMEDNMRGEAAETEMTMTTIRTRYTREISMKSWSLGEEYALIYISAPARDKGTAFLKRGNEMWNYVPNIDRTVKMPPSMMSQSWMGSDFTNDDLVRGTSTVDDFSHKLLGIEEMNGYKCYKIEMTPKPETPIVYEKVIRWVSTELYLPIRVENYDEYGELVNYMDFKEIKELDGRMVPTVMEMTPVDKPGHKTVITTHKANYSPKISPSFFSQRNLTIPR
jgi:outer membrane lipoprotein-sorting protein